MAHRSPKTIATINFKGGVGKTTVTWCLGDVKARVGKTGSCHLFRHTLATVMFEGGADVRYIQEMLGHERLDTTQVYTQVSIRALKAIHNATHPAAKLKRMDAAKEIADAVLRVRPEESDDLLEVLATEEGAEG